jgi:hypothetical protein
VSFVCDPEPELRRRGSAVLVASGAGEIGVAGRFQRSVTLRSLRRGGMPQAGACPAGTRPAVQLERGLGMSRGFEPGPFSRGAAIGSGGARQPKVQSGCRDCGSDGSTSDGVVRVSARPSSRSSTTRSSTATQSGTAKRAAERSGKDSRRGFRVPAIQSIFRQNSCSVCS